MKNHSEMIRDKSKRQLTAKGNKFVWRCIDIIAKSKGTSIYDNSPEFKAVKDKFRSIVHHLLIDKEMSQQDVISLIQKSKLTDFKLS